MKSLFGTIQILKQWLLYNKLPIQLKKCGALKISLIIYQLHCSISDCVRGVFGVSAIAALLNAWVVPDSYCMGLTFMFYRHAPLPPPQGGSERAPEGSRTVKAVRQGLPTRHFLCPPAGGVWGVLREGSRNAPLLLKINLNATALPSPSLGDKSIYIANEQLVLLWTLPIGSKENL